MPGFYRINPPPPPQPWNWKREQEGLAAYFVFGVLPFLLLWLAVAVVFGSHPKTPDCPTPTPERAGRIGGE